MHCNLTMYGIMRIANSYIYLYKMTSISIVFGEQIIRTNTRIQLLLKNMILHFSDKFDTMTPLELCQLGRALRDIRIMCLAILEDENDITNAPLTEYIPDQNDDNDEEDIVIDSLFPSSNLRDILKLSDTMLIQVFLKSMHEITSFASNELNTLLDLLDSGYLQHEEIVETIRNEVEARIALGSDISSRTMDVHIQIDKDIAPKLVQEQGQIHNSPLKKKLRQEQKRIESSDEMIREDDASSQKVAGIPEDDFLLLGAFTTNTFHEMMVRKTLEAAYDLGRARQRTSKCPVDENGHIPKQCSITNIYPLY